VHQERPIPVRRSTRDSALIIDVGRLGLLSLRTLAAVADDELPPVLRAPMFVHSERWLPTSAG
jgi:hypothetical protein